MKILLGDSQDIIRIDDDDLPFFSSKRWWPVSRGRTKYLQCRDNGIRLYFHRALLNAPADLVVDHIDGDGLNNCRENLRIVTQGENVLNRTHSKVSFRDGMWHAAMRVDGERFHVGFFTDEITARKAKAYVASILRGGLARGEIDYSDFDPLTLSPTVRKLIASRI